MQQNKENRKLKDWYHFIHTDCQMLVNITKITSDTTRMMIRLTGKSEKVIHFETEHYKEIVAVVKLYSKVSIKDSSNMLSKDDPRYAEHIPPPNNHPVMAQEPVTNHQHTVRTAAGSGANVISQATSSKVEKMAIVSQDDSARLENKNTSAISDNDSFESESVSITRRVDEETSKPILDDQIFDKIRNKKQGEIYMYYMSPTNLNIDMNSTSTPNNSKVFQRKTASKGDSKGYSKGSRYSDIKLPNEQKVYELAYIDFTKVTYEETLLNNLEKVLFDCFIQLFSLQQSCQVKRPPKQKKI